jgi:glutathione peroxidase
MKPILLIATFLLSLSLSAEESLYNIPIKDINNKAGSLKTHKGKVMLVVNVASQCGLTSQYKQLQAVYKKYSDKGFTVCGFPCNQFGRQEPGTLDEIKDFCSSKYDVSFPLYAKIDVNGDGAHPLYKSLKKQIGPAKISWNFEKFLIGKDGKVLKRFSPGTKPDAPEVIKAIETALK